MPKIPRNVIACAFYLYSSEEAARRGDDDDANGTGFFVSLSEGGHDHLYALTAWHVAVEGDSHSPVIKYREPLTGAPHVCRLDWHFVPGLGDAAIAAMPYDLDHPVAAIPTWMFLRVEDLVHQDSLSVGDDVVMVGLFGDHAGRRKVVPAARFGHISVMPDDEVPIDQRNTDPPAGAFVLDLRSRDGFSGSPVFAFGTFGNDLAFDPARDIVVEHQAYARETQFTLRAMQPPILRFLGMQLGQFSEVWDVMRLVESAPPNPPLVSDAYVQGLSSMSITAPAWRLLPLFAIHELTKHRAERIATRPRKHHL